MSKRIRPAYLAHVVRRTSERYRAMVDWYQAVLEADIVHQDDNLAFLSFDEEHHRIAIARVPGLPEAPPLAVGTDHIAFAYGGLGELLHTYRRLKEMGIEPYWPVNHGPTTSLYYRDPDGSSVELQVDNFTSAAEARAFMESGAFAENPIGVIFDPDRLLARYENGEPAEELLRRPPLPAGMTPVDMLRV